MTAWTDLEPQSHQSAPTAPRRPPLIPLVVLSAWCGLLAGLLEVTTILLRKQLFDPDQIIRMSQHFVWLIPLANLCVFTFLGSLAALVAWLWHRRGPWLFNRLLAAGAILPSVLIAFPHIYAAACICITLGAAAWFVPLISRHQHRFRQCVLASFPAMVAIVAIVAASFFSVDGRRQSAENARPLPPTSAPNILLIVMDTVAAGHVSLNGYARPTTTTLDELANRGIRFQSARASSSWTLPSHATMFTGKWLHDLSVGWLSPLNQTYPTVAESLTSHGYATAGFVANTWYCGTESGLSRGFTHYEDYIFPELTALKTAVLVKRSLEGFQTLVYFVEDWLEAAALMPAVERLWHALDTDRKGAAEVNRELLAWLAEREQPQRPFFAFLNYYDAHYPYQLQPTRLHRFGVEPTDNYQRTLIQNWWDIDKTTLSPQGISFAVDAYDDCIADLDEQIGKLVDQLDRRGVLEQTWLVILSDHGESFGEHTGVFCHGTSLYDTEAHVPLLIVPPPGTASPARIAETVSLRDLAATITEIAGVKPESPFPGNPLTRFWSSPSPPPSPNPPSQALAEVVPNNPRRRNYWGLPEQLPPLGAVKDREWSYIRRQSDNREELFHLADDSKEQRNLAADPTAQGTLLRLRTTLDQLTAGPLLPGRFSP